MNVFIPSLRIREEKDSKPKKQKNFPLWINKIIHIFKVMFCIHYSEKVLQKKIHLLKQNIAKEGYYEKIEKFQGINGKGIPLVLDNYYKLWKKEIGDQRAFVESQLDQIKEEKKFKKIKKLSIEQTKHLQAKGALEKSFLNFIYLKQRALAEKKLNLLFHFKHDFLKSKSQEDFHESIELINAIIKPFQERIFIIKALLIDTENESFEFVWKQFKKIEENFRKYEKCEQIFKELQSSNIF